LPAPGQITTLDLPSGPGIRIDSGIAPGLHITPYYDPMLAKVITHGRDRSTATATMRQVLSALIIEGLHTNLTLHQQIMDNADFQAGHVATDFLTKAFYLTPPPPRHEATH
jgi:acetyl-CoA carboxylase biotin carboxylase subunit